MRVAHRLLSLGVLAAFLVHFSSVSGYAQEVAQSGAGTLRLHVMAGEAPVSTSIKAYVAGTDQFVWPLQNLWENDVMMIKLPAGTYDIHVANPGLGGTDKVLKQFEFHEGATIEKTVTFNAIGTLIINAEWTGRPLLKQKLHYYWKHWLNIGGLMGGSYSPPPGGISIHYKITKDTGEELFETLSVGLSAPVSIAMAPGYYDLLVTPGYWDFLDEATPVEIVAGRETVQSYSFPWPNEN